MVGSLVVTPDVLIVQPVSDDERGWIAATKIARLRRTATAMLSGPSRGFEVSLSDPGLVSSVKRMVNLPDIVK